MSGPTKMSQTYDQLPSSQSFRLIRLCGFVDVPEIPDPVISISLSVVHLDSAPLFDALSYTWGDSLCRELGPSLLPSANNRRNVVSCDGVITPIRPNLHDALDMLLDTKDDSRAGFVWIDAICINQEDFDERASQVRLMDTLFMRASSVIAWLGPADATTANALIVLDKLAHLGRDAVPCSYEDQKRARDSVSHLRIDDIIHQKPTNLDSELSPSRCEIGYRLLPSSPGHTSPGPG